MAKKAYRPWRTLIVFGLVIACLYGGVALGGEWKPKLGLDLQGGTMITLSASTEKGQQPPADKLQEASSIINQRVNGSGVTESTVGTQGSRNIVIEIPGKNPKHLVDLVKQTAQLRFRLVAAVGAGKPQPKPSSSASPGAGSTSPGAKSSPSGKASTSPKNKKSSLQPSATPTPKGRALSSGLVNADKPSAKASKKPSAKASKKVKPSSTPSGATSPAPTATAPAQPQVSKAGAPVGDPLKWMDNPGDKWLKKFAAYNCPTKNQKAPKVTDNKSQPLITCDAQGLKYLLSAAPIQGTELKNAAATPPNQQQFQWSVNLTFNGQGRGTFATITRQIANVTSPLTGQQKQFAIVLDGQVISAPTVNGVIPNGQAEITGSFSQAEAQSLATSLKYGALPLKFTVPVVDVEGPSLAADQLSGGLWAGGIGLLLVLIYCLLYYRGLGLVVLASLGIAGISTFAVVLIMSKSLGFTLTLPGIAGLIVAVGITADSFIVYFERIRDEMRAGKSMRVAVEAGWTRARATCVAADSVSLLAATVLYIFAIGVVKGFAFTLGISTVIDLVVFFFFTKPMVSWLATFRFFNSGHKLSGLSPDHIGRERITGATQPNVAGGNA